MIDGSVLTEAIFAPDREAVAVLEQVLNGHITLHAVTSVYAQVFSEVVSLAQKRRISATDAHDLIASVLAIPVTRVPLEIVANSGAVIALARGLPYLPSCDVALAESRGMRLATADPAVASISPSVLLVTSAQTGNSYRH